MFIHPYNKILFFLLYHVMYDIFFCIAFDTLCFFFFFFLGNFLLTAVLILDKKVFKASIDHVDKKEVSETHVANMIHMALQG